MLATVASITSANRLKRCAAREGINVTVIQTPASLTKEGCGYSLRFADSAKTAVIACAREADVKIKAFFLEIDEEGKKSYQKL